MHQLNEYGKRDPDDPDKAKYSVDELRAILLDPESAHPNAWAANITLSAREPGWDKLNRYPKALLPIREILDRQVGKPKQHVEVEHVEKSLDECIRELVATMSADPWMFADIIGRVADGVPEAVPLILERLGGSGLPSPGADS